ncbi:MAG: M48 family metallopeptidase [Ruminiclostridium sp.]|nr:M48 family metallopeptidase [Ruminiclostridium sp.]
MKGILNLNGWQVDYELTYKKVKNVNIRVRSDGRVAVSAPQRVTQDQVESILVQRANFILSALEKHTALEQISPKDPRYHPGDTLWLLGRSYTLAVGKGPKNQVRLEEDQLLLTVKDLENAQLRARTVEAFYQERCREITTRLVHQIQPILQPVGVPVPEVKVRSMTSRWGSCTPGKKRVTFARQLIEAPLPCVEYVVWHELVHFIHPNHSAAFYGVLASFLPDWKTRRELLHSQGYRKLKK